MDVMRLDKTTYLADGLIEGFSSMIWTEKHKDLCDFQMKTALVDETMNMIPEDSFICIRDSPEVMLVETHEVGVDDYGSDELTVTGRSVECFLDNRVLTAPYREPWQIPGQYTVQDILMMHIWNSVVNPTAFEVIRDYAWDHLARDILPNVVVTDSTIPLVPPEGGLGDAEDLETVFDWWFQAGSIYPKVQELLILGNLGLRVIRPNSGPGIVLNSVENGALITDPKIVSKLMRSEFTELRFDVYNGRNRTATSAVDTPLDVNEEVIFSYDAGHIDTPSYLLSTKDTKNTIHMQSPYETVEVYPASAPAGWDLRMEWLESEPLDDSLSDVDYTKALSDAARAEYKRRQPLRLIDGGITAASPWVYGQDYYLGDLVTAMGRYGVKETKMVSEFIRSQDKDGYKEYPTLIDPP